MKISDVEYLCRVIGNLAGIPIRIYKKKEQVYCYSVIDLPIDPISPYVHKIFEINENIGYFTTPYFNYYGIVNSKSVTVVIGPSRQTPMSERDMRSLAFECGLDTAKTDEFISAMKTIIQMPLSSILQILCTMNFVMNKERRSLDEISIYDFDQMMLENNIEGERIAKSYEGIDGISPQAIHNTLAIENTLMQMISKGDVGALYEWLSKAPSVRGGLIANDTIRQLKNTFIVTATLSSRAAIKGGMDVEDALSLSDDYIRKCELMTGIEQIINLQYHMVLDYTRRVERVRLGKTPSRLLMQVTNYVQHNLSKPLDTEALAKSLYISRTHLARKFKSEAGFTLSEFIMREKTEEAKRLLRYSDKSLALISEYLGFSSQSHFTKVFKKISGKTPKEYRELHL